MANVKITDLTAYTDAASTDVLPIVDVASDVTKKVSISTLVKAVPAGTAAAPGIAIDGDPNTGVYSPGADQLSLSTGGVERFRIDSNGQLEAVSLGSAANPAYSFTTDPDTGIYSSGANQLALTTGGTGRVFVDANGRVGIGVSAPTYQLEVRGPVGNTEYHAGFGDASLPRILVGFKPSGAAGTTDSAAITADSIGGINIATRSGVANAILLHTSTGTGAAVERLRIDSSGNVTAATGRYIITSANAVGISDISLGSFAGGAWLNTPSGTEAYLAVNGNGAYRWSNATHVWNISGSERARIDGSGRLLLGTSTARSNVYGITPYFQAEGANGNSNRSTSVIYGENGIGGPLISLGKHRAATVGGVTVVNSGDELGQIVFTGADGTNFIQAATIKTEVDGTPGANDMPGRLVFSTTADGASSPTERMRITSAGLVGIGTTSPTEALTVAGNASFTLSGTERFSIKSSTSPLIEYKVATTNYFLTLESAGTSQGAILFNTGTTAASERARIDSSGRLLVGTSSTLSYVNSNPTTVNPRLQLAGVGEEGSSFGLFHFTTGGTTRPSSIAFARSQNGTVGQQGIVADGAKLGEVSFHGSDGIGFIHAANIRGEVDGVPGTNDMPGRIVFATTSDGASSPTERLRIDSTGQIEAAGLGSAAAPTYSWLSDTDSGLYSPGANQVALATNGTGRLFVGASGNIGVATNSPDVDLHLGVTPASTGSAGVIGFGDLGGYRFAQIEGFRDDGSYSGSLRFYTQPFGSSGLGGVERLRIDSSGRLLVGTSTALTNIYTGATATTPQIQLSGSGLNESSLSLLRTGPTGATIFLNAGSSGNTVQSSSLLGRLVFNGYDGSNYQTGGSILCEVDGTPGANDTPGRIILSTTADGASSPTERLRITSTGQVRLAGAGITFNGDTATANELDDYEEGTWTVELYDASSAGNISATTATGYYTKIGRLVSIFFRISNIDTTGMTGANVLFHTLPFAAGSNASTAKGTAVLDTVTFPAGRTYPVAYINSSAARGFIATQGTGVTSSSLTVSALTSGASDIEVSLTYFT